MPYLSTEQVKIRRQIIRKMFPDFKISVRSKNYSSICVDVLSGPLDLLKDCNEHTRKNGNERINHYYYKEHYKNFPEKVEMFDKIMEVANKGNGIESVDGDYGNIPNFYINIEIGRWDTPYVQT